MINDEVLVQCVLPCIPDVAERLEHFTVDASEVDAELMSVFIQQMQIDIDAIHTAMTHGNLKEAADRAHSIKGMGGTAGMPTLSVLAEDLEKASKAGHAARVLQLETVLNECFSLVKKMHG